MGWFSRIRAQFRKDDVAREQEEELAFHLSMRAQWNAERGIEDGEARREARLRFGNPSVWRERMSEIDGMLLPETVWQDLRYGARQLLRNMGFTVAAVLALAIGIGVNTAAFTAYKAFFNRPLDARESGRMVNLALSLQMGDTAAWFSVPDYEAYRDGVKALSGVIAAGNPQNLTLAGADGVSTARSSSAGTLVGRMGMLPIGKNTETASTFLVSDNYFSVLGVEPVRGRVFDTGEAAGRSSVLTAMISENYWQKRFGADPAVLGKTVRLNGIPFTIVGITPHNFVGTTVEAPDFWISLSAEPLLHPGDNWLRDRENGCCRIYGRLAADATMGEAQAEMTVLAGRLRSQHNPHSDLSKPVRALVWPGSPFPTPVSQLHGLRYVILLVLIAVGMVLVVACANVASLQLARAASRKSELAMRFSLGASRTRILRQLLTESALLGVVAGAVALLVSWALLQVVVTITANAFPADYGTFIFHVTPDPGIFAFVFALSLFAGVLFGLAPALESSRDALASANKSHAVASPFRSRRLGNLLTTAQVAVSMVLMIAGSMLIHSSIRALTMETGYETKDAVEVVLRFPEGLNYTAASKLGLAKELRSRLAAMPGVMGVTSARAPDDADLRVAAVSLDGESPTARNTRAVLYYSYVEPNFFRTLGIPLKAGRGFAEQASEPEQAVILSESSAQALWPGQSPIGRSIRLGTDGQYHVKGELLPDGKSYQVIGVARDTRGIQLEGTDSEQIYVPLPEERIADLPILVRTSGDPAQFVNAMAPVLASVDPDLVATAATLEQLLRITPSFMASSISAAVASAVGLLGLLLASMGIYGTVSYMVVRRTREVGIRMALGAKKRDVLVLMMRESTRPVMVGVVVGMCLAVGASYLLRMVLYGVGAFDGLSFGGVALLFLGIAFLASYLPSRRAMRVDPMVALRYE